MPTVKQVTKLGVAVNKYAHENLRQLLLRTRRVLNKMPKDYVYRVNVDKLIQEREEILNSSTDVLEIEKRMQSGQIEEIIAQSKRELDAAKALLQYKAWEPLQNQPPPNQWTWPPTK